MNYKKLTTAQVVHIANACSSGVTFSGETKTSIINCFNKSEDPYWFSIDRQRFFRACKIANDAVAVLRDKEWDAVHKAIEDSANE